MQRNDQNERSRVAFEYAREILTGAVEGVMTLVDDILHPIDNIIYPVSMLLYDSLMVSVGHVGDNPIVHPMMPDLSMAQISIQQNPQLYHDAVDRMNHRVQNISNQIQRVVDANGPQRAGMIANVATTILVPGKIVDGIKAGANFHRFGTPYSPPSFHNVRNDLPRESYVTQRSLTDIRSAQGTKSYIYVITNDSRLIIADRIYRSESIIGFNNLMVHHHDLARNFPVYSSGEILANNGTLSSISNSSGHYLPEGSHLARLTERAFRNHGFTEARNIYQDINVLGNWGVSPIMTRPGSGMAPSVARAGGVIGVIAEGLSIQQTAHEKIVQSERRHQSANMHTDRMIHQNILSNNRWYNLPYNSLTPRYNSMDLAWRVEQQAIFEFRLRYGSCPYWIQSQISSSVRSAVAMFVPSCRFGNGYHSYFDMSAFSLVLMCTNLVSSYNSYNFGSYMYSPWSTYGFIGGVATKAKTITDMIDSKTHALADDYYICFPSKHLNFQ